MWKTYLNLWFCNNQTILSWGEQGYVILIQTGAELMLCYSFCFSIHWHFVPSFVYHFGFWFSITLLSKSNSSDIISYYYAFLVTSNLIEDITVKGFSLWMIACLLYELNYHIWICCIIGFPFAWIHNLKTVVIYFMSCLSCNLLQEAL